MTKFTYWATAAVIICISVAGTRGLQDEQPSSPPSERIYESTEVDRKARLTSKPAPMYSERARQESVQGEVILRMVLRATGEVTDISVVKGQRGGLNDECIKVAKLITFVPAVKDGHPVSQYFKASYHFSIY